MIKIGIIEDDQSLRKTLVKFFEMTKEVEVLFTAESAEQGLDKVSIQNELDLILLDIGLPGMSGLDAIPEFNKVRPGLDIIILTSYEDEQRILKALCLGACAFISKREGLQPILKAVKLVNDGGSYMSPGIAREIVNYFISGEVRKPQIDLTERQHEIIKLMVDGKTYSTIAQELYISIDTVRYHIKLLYQALHANNKAEAISHYLKLQGG